MTEINPVAELIARAGNAVQSGVIEAKPLLSKVVELDRFNRRRGAVRSSPQLNGMEK
jgi:hypothetical protein